MALVAHQPQGVYLTFSSRRFIFSKRMQLKRCLAKHHMVGRTDWHCLLKRNICSSVGSPCISGSTHKPLRISAFKGNAQNDESVTRANGLKVPKIPVGLEESGEAKSESPKVHNVPLSYASKANESLATSSPAIHKLLKKWLTMLRTQPSTQETEEIMGEPPPGFSQETLQGPQIQKRGEVLKVAWSHFAALDATIKIPLLIFVPFYLAVNVIHGAEVSKELTPLWVLGPLVVAFYITIIRKLCALYVYSFKQTVKVLKTHNGLKKWRLQRSKEKKVERIGRMVSGEVPRFRGVNMALLLSDYQNFKEGKSHLSLKILLKVVVLGKVRKDWRDLMWYQKNFLFLRRAGNPILYWGVGV